jgi:hypothetical protein
MKVALRRQWLLISGWFLKPVPCFADISHANALDSAPYIVFSFLVY